VQGAGDLGKSGRHGFDVALLIGLVFAAVVLLPRTVAGRFGIPEATLLVVLAAAMGFIPGIPEVHLPPIPS
jgi:hypothetical protein